MKSLPIILSLLLLGIGCQESESVKRPQRQPVKPKPVADDQLDQDDDSKKPSSTPDKHDNEDQKDTPKNDDDDSKTDDSGDSGPPTKDGKIEKETLKTALTYFASDELEGRLSGTKGNEKARDYAIAELKKIGVKPGNNGKWLQEFNFNSQGQSGQTANVIGFMPGQDDELKNQYLVIGAHMDHLGARGSNVFNGADDNASGSIGVIAMAKYLSSLTGRKRSLIIMLFSGEELGLLGSQYYVDNPIYPLEDTVLMLNLDMIGYAKGQVQALGARGALGVGSRLTKIATKHPTMTVNQTTDSGGRSDHAPFLAKGVPITMFHTGAEHENYHQPTDTVEKIDYEGYMIIVKIAAELSAEVLSDAKFPSGMNLVPRHFLRTPVNEIFDYKSYFGTHGIGHQPLPGSDNNALVPGQPL